MSSTATRPGVWKRRRAAAIRFSEAEAAPPEEEYCTAKMWYCGGEGL